MQLLKFRNSYVISARILLRMQFLIHAVIKDNPC